MNVPHPVSFSWYKYKSNLINNRYKLEVARDYSFTLFAFNDSNITDTFKTVTGFLGFRTYFWRVSGFDQDSNKYISPTSIIEFETGFAMSVEIKCVLEGAYQPVSENLSNSFSVLVSLRNVNPPYSIVDSNSRIVSFPDIRIYPSFNLAPGGIYYIVLNTLNGIETWSKPGGEYIYVSPQGSYNFTDSLTQAYGNNLKLKGNYYCIYSGDVNQDGMIELEDLRLIDNDALYSVTGENIRSDLNYDNIVDLSDLSVCDNNVLDFITIRRP